MFGNNLDKMTAPVEKILERNIENAIDAFYHGYSAWKVNMVNHEVPNNSFYSSDAIIEKLRIAGVPVEKLNVEIVRDNEMNGSVDVKPYVIVNVMNKENKEVLFSKKYYDTAGDYQV